MASSRLTSSSTNSLVSTPCTCCSTLLASLTKFRLRMQPALLNRSPRTSKTVLFQFIRRLRFQPQRYGAPRTLQHGVTCSNSRPPSSPPPSRVPRRNSHPPSPPPPSKHPHSLPYRRLSVAPLFLAFQGNPVPGLSEVSCRSSSFVLIPLLFRSPSVAS